MACPFLLVGFDPRQIRPRLPAPGQARFRASPRQARPDYRRWAWGTPLACGLKPSGNRTVKTLQRSVFRQSSARAVSKLAARFPERFSPLVFGLHPVMPSPARHRTAMRWFHQSSSWSGRVLKKQSGRPPAGKILPIRAKGSPLRAGTGNACVSPARARRFPQDPCNPYQRQASARPGGDEAPGGGGAGAGRGQGGAGRGLWGPGWPGISGALWQGRWPLPAGGRARRQKSFLRSGQAAPAAGTLSAPCQGLARPAVLISRGQADDLLTARHILCPAEGRYSSPTFFGG
jgi:hypothetical protein